MNRIVLDIETKNTFQDVGSRDPRALDISLLVIYDFADGQYKSFLVTDLKRLWPIFEKSDMIIGFNSDSFDIPLLNKYYPGDLTKLYSLDLLEEVRKSMGRRVPLDALAAGTLGTNKTGKGLEAVSWWRNGEIDKIRKYCEEDVKITKELYEYALKHQALKYKLLNEVYTFPVDTGKWQASQRARLNYTLPF